MDPYVDDEYPDDELVAFGAEPTWVSADEVRVTVPDGDGMDVVRRLSRGTCVAENATEQEQLSQQLRWHPDVEFGPLELVGSAASWVLRQSARFAPGTVPTFNGWLTADRRRVLLPRRLNYKYLAPTESAAAFLGATCQMQWDDGVQMLVPLAVLGRTKTSARPPQTMWIDLPHPFPGAEDRVVFQALETERLGDVLYVMYAATRVQVWPPHAHTPVHVYVSEVQN
jgi:hypothetical protein